MNNGVQNNFLGGRHSTEKAIRNLPKNDFFPHILATLQIKPLLLYIWSDTHKKVSHVRLKDPAGEVSVFCLGQRFKSQLKFQLTGPRGFPVVTLMDNGSH